MRIKGKKKPVAILVIFILLIILSYLAVYKGSFMPGGFDIASEQKEKIILKSLNTSGFKENVETIVFSKDEL